MNPNLTEAEEIVLNVLEELMETEGNIYLSMVTAKTHLPEDEIRNCIRSITDKGGFNYAPDAVIKSWIHF